MNGLAGFGALSSPPLLPSKSRTIDIMATQSNMLPMSSAQSAFTSAIQTFKKELDDPALYDDILKTTSIDEVYDVTEDLQKTRPLRHLSKISPYLDRLNDYAASIELFVQIKPDILALIWGPIKLLLQWTSVLTSSFDAIIKTIAEIGELLPEFQRVAAIFEDSQYIYDVLALFFKDILDFYVVALKFFKLSRMLISCCYITQSPRPESYTHMQDGNFYLNPCGRVNERRSSL